MFCNDRLLTAWNPENVYENSDEERQEVDRMCMDTSKWLNFIGLWVCLEKLEETN